MLALRLLLPSLTSSHLRLPQGDGVAGKVRFFRKQPTHEQQYVRYRTAREAIAYEAMEVDDPSMKAARAEMLRTMGPAFDPTVRSWARLDLIDAKLREYMTRSIDPTLEDPRDLDAYAEQILAIVALDIEVVTPEILLDLGRNFVVTIASRRARELVQAGHDTKEADEIAFEDAVAVAKRYLASTNDR